MSIEATVLFDVAVLPGGRYLALGTTGYLQNPSGASISEAAQPLLALLNSDGSLAQNSATPEAPPQPTDYDHLSEWPLAAWRNDQWSWNAFGDADRKLIVADGFLREGIQFATQ